MIELKDKLEDYSEAEFLLFLEEFFSNKNGLEADALSEHLDSLLDYFELITEHPRGADVICYPEEGQEDSPEGVLKEVKRWRALSNKPGFKSA